MRETQPYGAPRLGSSRVRSVRRRAVYAPPWASIVSLSDRPVVAVTWEDERLVAVLVAFDGRPEVLGLAVGVSSASRAVTMTLMVEADTRSAAAEIAERALSEELRAHGPP